MTKRPLSIHQIWRSKKIHWIETYKTIIKYVSRDYVDIFKPIIMRSGSGRRYFVEEKKVNKFVQMFKNNELLNKKTGRNLSSWYR